MGGDIKGGGMTIYEVPTEMNMNLIYKEGLRVPNPSSHLELDDMFNTTTMGKKKAFERVKFR